MKRNIEQKLFEWKNRTNRKPIILRGARQVGKTYIVREFSKLFDQFVEINFERDSEAAKIFERDLDAKRIIRELSIFKKKQIKEGQTLLFLDEIQVAPKAILALRYFYEETPELHVISAGSLLDFSLEKIGVPVGRVSFLQLYPMSFLEFLGAVESNLLVGDLQNYDYDRDSIYPHHEKLLRNLGEYLAIGGMPEVVKVWRDTNDLQECRRIQTNIVQSYKQDFEKYSKKHELNYVDLVFNNIPRLLSEKFKYSKVSTDYKSRELAPCLDLLVKARVVHKVVKTNAQEVPLGAGVKPGIFKAIFLDVGLAQAILGLELGDWILNPIRSMENKGALVEAFVGQELLANSNPEIDGELYYWLRDKAGSKAEVDYVIQKGSKLIPIEVKSGITGGLKSLIRYVTSIKGSDKGIHFSLRHYSENEKYTSLPLYQVARLF